MIATPSTQVITVTADVLAAFATAFPQTDEGRLTRAVALVNGDHCERLPTLGLFLIRSASHANRAHTVDACTCSCEDFQKRGGMCMHRIARSLYLLAERADVEQSDPTPDEAPPSCPLHGDEECDWGCPGPSLDPRTVTPDPDAYYCVLCEEPIPAAEVVETRWGFMHERCAATEPRETDEDARYELTGRGYLTLIHSAALPAPIGTIQRVPVVLSARAAQAASELYEDYPTDAA